MPTTPSRPFSALIDDAIHRTRLTLDQVVVELAARDVSVSRRSLLNYKSEASTPTEPRQRAILSALADIAGDTDGDDFVMVPELAVEASAGDGADVDEAEVVVGYMAINRVVARHEYGFDPDRLRTIVVRGTSNYPTLRPGQRLVVSLYAGEDLVDGAFYVMTGPSGRIIKRLKLRAGVILVVSDNHEYETLEVPVAEFRSDYEVHAMAVSVSAPL
ncbi:S24 family peptidase [Rubrivirga sp.]|uniref:S24 family peptidase n=1 Tax=Rubrivirga sp. TaxID=1885344 RepID=UPI003C735AD7